jgi:hypothetical protein
MIGQRGRHRDRRQAHLLPGGDHHPAAQTGDCCCCCSLLLLLLLLLLLIPLLMPLLLVFGDGTVLLHVAVFPVEGVWKWWW